MRKIVKKFEFIPEVGLRFSFPIKSYLEHLSEVATEEGITVTVPHYFKKVHGETYMYTGFEPMPRPYLFTKKFDEDYCAVDFINFESSFVIWRNDEKYIKRLKEFCSYAKVYSNKMFCFGIDERSIVYNYGILDSEIEFAVCILIDDCSDVTCFAVLKSNLGVLIGELEEKDVEVHICVTEPYQE